jgi:hypothetical protein
MTTVLSHPAIADDQRRRCLYNRQSKVFLLMGVSSR